MSTVADRLDAIAGTLEGTAADLRAAVSKAKVDGADDFLDELLGVADDLRALAVREHDAWVASLSPWPLPSAEREAS